MAEIGRGNAAPIRVLFVCTGNSARSVLSEATLNALGKGRFVAYSAGSQPSGRVNPRALKQIAARGWPTGGYRSKSWDEFTVESGPALDIVVTVCDSAAQETCPVYFGDFVSTHWGLPDPTAATGSEADIDAAFAQAHRIIEHRVAQLVALPIDTLSSSELRDRLDAIGRSSP
ncbi:MAG TPA: arsenate reductase ArsC [Candidatus Saccharimonadia bacterium]|nr:arsenate reductase ArsC [Candidatus Saccharimonadia bacterium]